MRFLWLSLVLLLAVLTTAHQSFLLHLFHLTLAWWDFLGHMVKSVEPIVPGLWFGAVLAHRELTRRIALTLLAFALALTIVLLLHK